MIHKSVIVKITKKMLWFLSVKLKRNKKSDNIWWCVALPNALLSGLNIFPAVSIRRGLLFRCARRVRNFGHQPKYHRPWHNPKRYEALTAMARRGLVHLWASIHEKRQVLVMEGHFSREDLDRDHPWPDPKRLVKKTLKMMKTSEGTISYTTVPKRRCSNTWNLYLGPDECFGLYLVTINLDTFTSFLLT